MDGEKPEPIQTDVEPKLTVEPIDDMEIEVVDCTEIEESVPMQDCCLQVRIRTYQITVGMSITEGENAYFRLILETVDLTLTFF